MAYADTLVLSGMGTPPYSVRGITQTLEPIAASASFRRTVNGTLVDLTAPEFRKYRSTLSCEDHDPPALEGVWPGRIVIVDCIVELCCETHTAAPERTPVAGSERQANGFTFYRPQLTMMVVGPWRLAFDKWAAKNVWQLDLEEV